MIKRYLAASTYSVKEFKIRANMPQNFNLLLFIVLFTAPTSRGDGKLCLLVRYLRYTLGLVGSVQFKGYTASSPSQKEKGNRAERELKQMNV